jgi:hypothetical protein
MTIQWITPNTITSDRIEYQPDQPDQLSHPNQPNQPSGHSEDQWQTFTGAHTILPEGYPLFLHRAELTNLQPDTKYTFRLAPGGTLYKFCTMPANLRSPVRFVAGGDVYHDTIADVQRMHVQAAAANPAFALVGGDIAYSARRYAFLYKLGLTKEKIERWMDFLVAWQKWMIRPDGCLIPIIPAIGNHETMGGYKQTPAEAPFFYAFFPMPGYQGYNVLDFGSYLSIILLDSQHTHPIEGAQTHWLFHTLEKRQHIPHKFALYHVGAFPSVRSINGDIDKRIRRSWVPIFERFGLNAAFENHEHAYKRTHPLRNGMIDPTGVVYMGDGAWGIARPRTPKTPEKRRYLAKSAAVQNVLIVTISEQERHFRAIGTSGETIDELTQRVSHN